MNIIRNWKMGRKLFGLVFLAGIFLLTVGYVGYNSVQGLRNNLDEAYNERLIPAQWFSQIRTNMIIVDASMLELMLTTDTKRNQELKEKIDNAAIMTDDLLSKLGEKELDQQEQEELLVAKDELKKYREGRREAAALALNNHNVEAYQVYVSKMEPHRQKMVAALDELVTYNQDLAKQTNDNSTAEVVRTTWTIIGLTLLSLVLCSIAGALISRMVSRPVKEMQGLMQKVKEGDLTVYGTYQSKDEIGQLTKDFNDTIKQLHGIIQKVNENAVTLSSNSEELSAGSEQTSQATQQIAAAIQEIAAGAETQLKGTEECARAIGEMTVGIGKIAESSSIVSESTVHTSKEAESGNLIIQQAMQQMREIQSSVGESADMVKQLGLRSNEIGEIVAVITNIADQTNLLALNAAIEAARAGEHGRGFSVVADEVRKLAELSKESTERITSIIHQIQSETLTAASTMEKGTHDVEGGVKIVQEAGEKFEHIVYAIDKIAAEIQEVSAASKQMAAGSEELSATVVEVENSAKISLENSQRVAGASEEQLASVEEVASSIFGLNQMAQDLQEMTRKFKISE